ncbi:YtpI family protein [Calidifontibacillus erzurumensis]|uniref:YtpI family protein n=1 Tax=Calidifontibacillus erzurumensis TaxID=2741433 RepID=A0A8J8GC87_9BACI|nr:YtpI family protein [Calidifontibacillus erzurumensis]NSL51285.1 YtpI family protein [Calidifontibacillus erzurumensis]
MPIFAVLSVLCITAYVFFRIKYFRIKLPYYRQWTSSKATIALGLFMFFFGLDQLIIWRDKVAIIVGIVFAVVGLVYAYQGYRAFKYYQVKAIEEAEEQYKNKG